MEFPPPPRLEGEVPAYAPVPKPDGPSRPGTRPGAPFAVVGVLVVVALIAVAILALAGPDERSADDRLEAAQSFVAAATSVSLDYDVEATITSGDPGSRASSVSTERMGGVVEWTPQAWRVRQESRFGEDETLLVDDTLYTRSSFGGSTLEDELWYEMEWTDPSRDELVEAIETFAELLDDEEHLGSYLDAESLGVLLGASIYIGGLDRTADLNSELMDDPVGFAESIRSLSEPMIAGSSGDTTTLAAMLHAPADLVEAFGHPIPSGVVELDVDADDVPVAMRLEIVGGASQYRVELRFDGWGDALTIERPGDDEIESFENWGELSEFEEQEYAAPELTPVDGLVPVRPSDSIGSWRLDYADAYDNYFSDEPECEKVAYLSWFLEGSDDAGWGTFVNVDLMTRSCAQVAADDLGIDAVDAQAPPPGEVVTVRVDEYTWLLLHEENAALVMIDTDDDALVPAIGGSLELVDWDTLGQLVDGSGF